MAKIPGKHDCLQITAVTDSAANMSRSVKDCDNIDEHLRCLAHILNNAVNAGFRNAIKPILTKCKNLAAATHKSHKTCELIREACTAVGIPYIKVIQPVKTRWNSMSMTMESVLALRQAFEHIKANEDAELDHVKKIVSNIPTKNQFETLDALVPHLTRIRAISERMSADTKPTVHLCIMVLVTLNSFESKNHQANQFLSEFKAYLSDKAANCGREDMIWAMACFLHPKFKGSILHYVDSHTKQVKADLYEETKANIIRLVQQRNSVRAPLALEDDDDDDVLAPTPPSSSTTNLDKAISEGQWSAVEEFLQHVDLLDFGKPTESAPLTNDITQQIEKYIHKFEKTPESDCDILAFWKANQADVPDLARFARSILGIPASSATSERLFSQAGKTISETRTKISAARAEQLIFINTNYDRAIQHIRHWDIGAVGKKKKSVDLSKMPPCTSAQAIEWQKEQEALLRKEEEEEELRDVDDEDWNFSDVDLDLDPSDEGESVVSGPTVGGSGSTVDPSDASSFDP